MHFDVDLPILLASAHSTSISIQWTVNATMEEYQIVHTYLGPCPITDSSGTASVSGNSTSYTIFDIYGFSIYNITLAGLKDGIWYQSSVQISTLSAGKIYSPSPRYQLHFSIHVFHFSIQYPLAFPQILLHMNGTPLF